MLYVIQFLDPCYYFVSGENSLWTMVNTMFHIIVAEVSTVHGGRFLLLYIGEKFHSFLVSGSIKRFCMRF